MASRINQDQTVWQAEHSVRTTFDYVDHQRIGQLPRNPRVCHPRQLQQFIAQTRDIDQRHRAIALRQRAFIDLELVEPLDPVHFDPAKFEAAARGDRGELLTRQGGHTGSIRDHRNHSRRASENQHHQQPVPLGFAERYPRHYIAEECLGLRFR